MSGLIQRKVRGHRWMVLPEWLPILLGPGGLPLDRWQSEGRLRVVKDSPHRAVYRVEIPGRAFYVKHYRCPRLGDVARHLVQACPAQREFRKIVEVAGRGIPTVRPVAWGCRVRFGLARDSFLVTEALDDACTLRDYFEHVLPQFPPAGQPGARRRLIDDVARFTAAVHQAGVLHRDFHAGNILVAPASPAALADAGSPAMRLYLIDLPGARLTGPLGWRASCLNLAVLASAWLEDSTRAERWRFWLAYRACRPGLACDLAAGAEEVDRLGVAHCLGIHRQRDKRSLRTNRDFFTVKTRHGEAHGVTGLEPEELVHWLLAPDEPLWRGLHRPVKLGHTSVVVEAEWPLADGCPGPSGSSPAAPAGPCRVALKRYRPRSWWKAVTGLVRASRARRGWCAGHALLQRGVATPRPVALCEPRRPRLSRASYLATEWIDGAENLHLWGWRIAALAQDERRRLAGRCARSVGRLVGRLHAFGVAHRDLKASNVLVAQRGQSVQTWLIDVDGIRVGHLTRRRQLADLARLAVGLQAHPWVGRTLACRFLRAYVGQFPRQRPDWKQLWRAVARLSAGLARKKRRRDEQVL